MKNKILVEIIVPDIEQTYSVFIPINKKIGAIINYLNKAIKEMSNNVYTISNNCLYLQETGEKCNINSSIKESNIRNGSILVLL